MQSSPTNISASTTIDVMASKAARSDATPRARGWPPLLAAALGAIVLFGVGFAPGIAHNAAHDTRHAMTFPCH